MQIKNKEIDSDDNYKKEEVYSGLEKKETKDDVTPSKITEEITVKQLRA